MNVHWEGGAWADRPCCSDAVLQRSPYNQAPWGDGRRETTVAGAAATMSVDVSAGGSPMLHEYAEEADEPDF